jgi:hypothetical protein
MPAIPILRLLVLLFIVNSLPAQAQELADDSTAVVTHPSQAELEQGFARWAAEKPDAFTFEERGRTLEGRPMLMGRITDSRVPDEDKQVALLTSAHGAKEMNAVTGLLRFMKWLISEDPEAAEIRRRQIVLVVPYTDPDYIARGDHRESRPIYGGWAAPGMRLWSVNGVARPERHPEAAAVQGIMDEYQPELHIDYHGFNNPMRTMWDSTGVSWASAVARPFVHDVAMKIDAAAEQAGFLITRGEQDDGKIRTTSPVEGFPDYTFYLRNAFPIFSLYPYCRYHTLAFIMETGSEDSLVVRTKRALQIGHERARYERYEGYPVNQLGIHTLLTVAAYGRTAAERRRSRVELWQKLPHLYFGTAAPTPARDTLMGYVSTRGSQKNPITNRRVDKVIERLEDNPQFDAAGLRAAAALFPYGAFGGPRPQRKVEEGAIAGGPIEHGIVLRLMVPYGDAEITEVRLDGHLIQESETHGYHLTRGPGVIVEIAIPPGKVRDFHIVSCNYDTPTIRRPGFTPQDW